MTNYLKLDQLFLLKLTTDMNAYEGQVCLLTGTGGWFSQQIPTKCHQQPSFPYSNKQTDPFKDWLENCE